MRRVWGWVKRDPCKTAAFVGVFLAGLLIGGVLGWVGPGRRSVNWGTAGEWVGGLVTAGALWWAVRAFLVERRDLDVERRDREMVHARSVTVRLKGVEWVNTDPPYFRVPMEVVNQGVASVTNVVMYVQVGDCIQTERRQEVLPRSSALAAPQFYDLPHPDSAGAQVPRVWAEFRDVEQRWWHRQVDALPTPLSQPPPETSNPYGGPSLAQARRLTADRSDQ
jgi:hypothetical protein